MAEILQQLDHFVKMAATAAEAKEALANGNYDVLLVDVDLPDMSGVDLAKLARMADPGIGVVFATGHSEVPEAVAVTGSIVLTKLYGQANLMLAIQRVT